MVRMVLSRATVQFGIVVMPIFFSFHIGELELLFNFNISNLLKAYHIGFGIEVQVVNELDGSFSTR